jgi:GNAT superfamily N-acetyltransferase
MNASSRQDRVPPESILLRTALRPGDLEAIVRFHCDVYGSEFGFDEAFEPHVSEPLEKFARSASKRERIWIAERGAAMVGCIAIVDAGADTAQLRWFLVAPDARGNGLGRRLLAEAIAFSRASGSRRIILWTVDVLEAAARLYRSAGFERVESRPARLWGLELAEEMYALELEGNESREDAEP